MSKRILVTGSRKWVDYRTIADAIWRHMSDEEPGTVVVHGGAAGADSIADVAARTYRLVVEVHHPSWDVHGKAAGPIRNQHMVDLGADVCLAFVVDGQSRGTLDCLRRAEKAGIPTEVYRRALPSEEKDG